MDLIPRPFNFIERNDWAKRYVRAAASKLGSRDALTNTDRINLGSALFDTVEGRQPTQAELFGRLSQFIITHPSWSVAPGPLHLDTSPRVAFLDLDTDTDTAGGSAVNQPSLVIPGTLRRYMPPGLIKLGTNTGNGDVIVTPSSDAEAAAMRTFMERTNSALQQQGARIDQLIRWSGPSGPVSTGYDANAGYSAGYDGEDPFHGGTIASSTQNVPDGAASGVFYNIAFSDEARGRMGGTLLEAIYVAVNPVNGQGAFVNALYLAQATVLLNGYPLPQLANIPLEQIAPTVIGDRRAFRTKQVVKRGDILSVRLDLIGNVPNTNPGANSAVTFYGDFARLSSRDW